MRLLLQRIGAERRAVVTNDIADFQPIHERALANGEVHEQDDALRNRVHYLP